MSKLLILGAGGLGQMVGEVARAAGNWDGVAFLDDAVRGADVAGKCMDYTSLTGEYPEAVAAFGDNRLRLAWTRRLLDAGYRVPSVAAPQPSSAVRGAWAGLPCAARGHHQHQYYAGRGMPCKQRRAGGPR